MKRAFSRREWLLLNLAGAASLACGLSNPVRAGEPKTGLHRQLLELAARAEERRRARFTAVKTRDDLETLQNELREKFLRLIGGLPEAAGTPPVTKTGQIDADGYVIEKLAYQSFPGYFVPALLYRPKTIDSPRPAVLSPCGHSPVGKAADSYQILHVNLARRGFIVLTYDPVGQGERSQFWDAAKGASQFNLTCGEHAVLGNPLYLLGSSLARYRIHDGIRGIDYLASLPEVDVKRIGCAGNSGGGTLTAYIAALDPRVAAAAICCYITTLPQRMGNRIEADPDADPEQDIFGFVSEGIDHAGLLALRAPRPTLLGTARFDFFPIEGARESFAEGRQLFTAAGAGERIDRVEAAERHGLTLPLRQGVYRFFDRWLAGGDGDEVEELKVAPRPAKELLVCRDRQVNITFRSRPLLPMALEEFRKAKPVARASLRDLLALDPQSSDSIVTEIVTPKAGGATVLLVNGNETGDWRDETKLLEALAERGCAALVVDPRGAGRLRHTAVIKGRDYADALAGVEENLAYNAFLVGRSLLGMRVTDVLETARRVRELAARQRLVLCGRRDAALVAVLAAAVDPAIDRVAAEGLLLSFLPLFDAEGSPINAASILPGLLRRFGDVPDALAAIAPRKTLIAAGIGELPRPPESMRMVKERIAAEPRKLIEWLDA